MKKKLILSDRSIIDWTNIDWSKTDFELSKKYKLPAGIFFLRRQQFFNKTIHNTISKYKNIYTK